MSPKVSSVSFRFSMPSWVPYRFRRYFMRRRPPEGRWATVAQTKKMIVVYAMSGGAGIFRDASAFQEFFDLDVSDEVLGHAVRSALAASRYILPWSQEGKRQWDVERINAEAEAWGRMVAGRFGFRDTSSVLKPFLMVNVTERDGSIEFKPTRQNRDGNTVDQFCLQRVEKFHSGETSECLGGAARRALANCGTIYSRS